MFDIIFNKIKLIFKASEPHSKSTVYKDSFKRSLRFTLGQGLSLDRSLSMENRNVKGRYADLVEDVASYLPEALQMFEDDALSPVNAFGGHCANVHRGVLNFILAKYPDVVANIVVGEVSSGGFTFEFDQAKCRRFLDKSIQPELSDFHVWINIDSDFIVDCTFGTFINTRMHGACEDSKVGGSFGGVIYGEQDDLKNIQIFGLKHCTPKDYARVRYTPVIVGLESLYALGPKY